MEHKEARKTSKFMIGLFVTVGTLIGIVFIVWMGASKYFEKGITYVTYFDESVQGLQVDSSVKYRGVEVGRVLKIGVAPDNKLVEVVMKINFKEGAESNLTAQLKAVGITGIVFIDLDRREKSQPILGPEMKFVAEYPVIPSRPSDMRLIMTGLADIYGKIQKIDFEGISERLKGMAKSVDNFFNNVQLANTIKHIESTTKSLDGTTQKIDKLIAEGKVDNVLLEARKSLLELQDSLSEARRFIAEVRSEIEAMKMADTAGRANRFLDHLDQTSRVISYDMEETLQGIKSNSENLNKLLEKLQQNPSTLIFGSPGPRDGKREE